MYLCCVFVAQIEVSVELTNLADQTAAHIHGGAIGSSGAVLYTLPTGSFSGQRYFLTSSEMTELVSGRTYINVHSSAHAGGVLRAQVCVAS